MGFGRTHNIEDLTSNLINQDVTLGGWIEDLRKLGKMTFMTLRDANWNYTKLL